MRECVATLWQCQQVRRAVLAHRKCLVQQVSWRFRSATRGRTGSTDGRVRGSRYLSEAQALH